MSRINKKVLHPISSLREAKQRLIKLENTVGELLKSNHYLLEELEHSKNSRSELRQKIEGLERVVDIVGDRISDMVHRVSMLDTAKQTKKTAASNSPELLADNHSLDSFYVKFENTFRGSEESIQTRQKVYLPYFKKIKAQSIKKPVLDIGCGRGEFLSLLQDNDIHSVGLDLNIAMVNRVIERGGEAYNVDALSYLRRQKSDSLSAITGFHIVEHIPFDQLLDIFNECHRVLTPGGFTLFETPNPENLVVGTHNFYMDPSHLHPIPPALLDFTMNACGFSKTEVKRLHPLDEEKLKGTKTKPVDEISKRFYGPQDYAVIAHK